MTIYICGDSTAASYTPEQAPITGWGQVLGELLPGMEVYNHAMAGRSSKSFLYEGRLLEVEKRLKSGDVLLIQFAHNDESDLVWRHTDPYLSYSNCLSVFIDTARDTGAIPVLLTPICQRFFEGDRLLPNHDGYLQAMQHLARQRQVPLIDVYSQSHAAVQALGDEASKELYLHVEPDIYPAYIKGAQDNTHTRRPGALMNAGFVARGLKELGLVTEVEAV